MTLPIGLTASAVDALRDTLRAALPAGADGVALFDGPAPERAYAPRAVTIAAAFQDDQDAVTVERVETGARPDVTERLTVACSVYAGGGNTDVEQYRAEAGQIITLIDTALRDNRTLGGAVSLARLVSAQWLQGRDAKGTGVSIGFTIELATLS
jgi:hypothetical protein